MFPVISFEWCRVWGGGSLREKCELVFLCCLQVSVAAEMFPGVWAGRVLVRSWAFAEGLSCVMLDQLLLGLGFVLNESRLRVEFNWLLPC